LSRIPVTPCSSLPPISPDIIYPVLDIAIDFAGHRSKCTGLLSYILPWWRFSFSSCLDHVRVATSAPLAIHLRVLLGSAALDVPLSSRIEMVATIVWSHTDSVWGQSSRMLLANAPRLATRPEPLNEQRSPSLAKAFSPWQARRLGTHWDSTFTGGLIDSFRSMVLCECSELKA
jgi:hypothetical protein